MPGREGAEAACPSGGRRGCWGPSAAVVQSAAARKSATETHRRRSAAEPDKGKIRALK